MPSPTREEFLSYVHTPLTNAQGDPLSGSPTKSTMRYRWRELRDWDVEADAREYWDMLPDEDKDVVLINVREAYWEFVREELDDLAEPFIAEPTLQGSFTAAFRNPHNRVIKGASDA